MQGVIAPSYVSCKWQADGPLPPEEYEAKRRMRALPAFLASRAEAICCVTKWTDLKKKMRKSPDAPCIPTRRTAHIELINDPFIFKDKGSPAEYGEARAGARLARDA
jgi:hypothetical protein